MEKTKPIVGIGFSTTNYPLSWLIRKLTSSPVSHAWVYIDDNGRKTVIEATIGGVCEMPFETFKSKCKIVELFIPRHDLSGGINFARSLVKEGFSYDYDELVGGLWVQIGDWFKQRWHNPFSNPKDKELDCIELVIRFMQFSNYPGTIGVNPGDVAPVQLTRVLKAFKEPTLTV